MVQVEALQTNLKRLTNFLVYTKNYLIRHNPIKEAADSIVTSLKEALTVRKKLKMARYRVNYNLYRFNKLESQIAENNQHTFLTGKNLNATR